MHIFMGFFHIPLKCLTEESLPERNHFPKKLFTSIYYINLLIALLGQLPSTNFFQFYFGGFMFFYALWFDWLSIAASEQLVTAVLMICWAVSSVSIALRLIAFFICRVSLRHGSAAWLCVLTLPTTSSPLTLILALQLLRRLCSHSQDTTPLARFFCLT